MLPAASLWMLVLWRACTGLGFIFWLTSPRPSWPFLYIPQAQRLFSSPTRAKEWFSPQARAVTLRPSKHMTLLGTVTSEVTTFLTPLTPACYLARSSTAICISSRYVSSPSCPRSLIPHPYNSLFAVKKSVNAAPQIILDTTVSNGRNSVILVGSGFLLRVIPSPGSKLSPEIPMPSCP